MASKLFRVSEQAQDNFSEFVKSLNDFHEKGQIGEQKSILLIMDEATAIVYFSPGTQKVVVEVDAKLPNNDYALDLLKPGQCDDNRNCVCLFREADFETEFFDKITINELKGKITVIPKQVVCTSLDYSLEVESCNIGEGTLVDSYTCSNGFMIERHLAKESSVFVGSYYKIPRRTVLYFTKTDANTINLLGNYGGSDE
jgi:hypothetical protein